MIRRVTLPVCVAGGVMRLGRRTVLLVEDEEAITAPLREALEREGFDTRVARTAGDALAAARQEEPDVVLLDVMLPDGSGFDVCRELRRDSKVPIIMVTARGDEADRIVGLELGADDYVTKPFSAREVAARIRAVLRRVEDGPGDAPAAGRLSVGELALDPAGRTASFAGEPLALSRKEFEVLALLAQRPGVVFRREQIISEVWRTSWEGTGRTLEVHIASLRGKLGLPALIETVRGVGYRLVVPAQTV
jgi:DNA-binding response OmpR family regulator